MTRLRNLLPLVVAAAAAILGPSNPAQAGYAVRVYDDSTLAFEAINGVVTVGTGSSTVIGNSLTFTTSTTNFSITNGSGLSNNPGNQKFTTFGLNGGAQVSANFGSGSHSVEIQISQSDFTAPVGTPVTLATAGGGSGYTASQVGNSVTVVGEGFLDNTNGLFGVPGVGGSGTTTATNTAAVVTGLPSAFNFSGTAVNYGVPGISAGQKFSMTNDVKMSFTLGSGSQDDLVGVSLTTIASVPAPAGLGLALAGIPCLGFGTWLRRRWSV